MSMTMMESSDKCLGNDDHPCNQCPDYLDSCDGKEDYKGSEEGGE